MSVREYNARLRPWRIGYAAAIAAVVIAVGVIVKIAYSHGEISHATLRTAANPAPAVSLGTTSATLSRAWDSADHTASVRRTGDGTVVTYSEHAVTGRDGLSGKPTWSYTRADRTTCTAAQLGGVTIAVFEVNGNCDELTALDTETGVRQWVRTLDKDGHELNGHSVLRGRAVHLHGLDAAGDLRAQPGRHRERRQRRPGPMGIRPGRLHDQQRGARFSRRADQPDLPQAGLRRTPVLRRGTATTAARRDRGTEQRRRQEP